MAGTAESCGSQMVQDLQSVNDARSAMAGIDDNAEMYLRQAETGKTCALKEEFDQMSIEDQKLAIAKMRDISLNDPKSTVSVEPFAMLPAPIQYQSPGFPVWSSLITNKTDKTPVFQVWWMPGLNLHGTTATGDCSTK